MQLEPADLGHLDFAALREHYATVVKPSRTVMASAGVGMQVGCARGRGGKGTCVGWGCVRVCVQVSASLCEGKGKGLVLTSS